MIFKINSYRPLLKVKALSLITLLLLVSSCSKKEFCEICLEDALEAEGDFGSLFIPNIFTPNLDGSNDYYWIGYNFEDGYKIDEFQIFDSNALLVYEVQQPNELSYLGWDGKIDGKIQYGEYSYQLSVSNSDESELFQGTLYSIECLNEFIEYPYISNCKLPDFKANWSVDKEQIEYLKCL